MVEMWAGQTPKWSAAAVRVRFFGLPGWSEVCVFGHRHVLGERAVDLAGDGAFQHPQNLFISSASLEVAVQVAAGGRVVGHPDQGDAVQGLVGVPVPAAG